MYRSKGQLDKHVDGILSIVKDQKEASIRVIYARINHILNITAIIAHYLRRKITTGIFI